MPFDDDAAEEAGLRYVSDERPGITRRRVGKGFSYRTPQGGALRDSATLRRIRALAIPPAWTQVWICPQADGHIQATGRDERGRKQYRYHPRWRELRDAAKYDHLLDFARALPAIRARIEADMGRPGLPREKMLATVVHLLETPRASVGPGGTGRIAARVAPEASDTLGLDISPAMIAEAQRRHRKIPRLRFATIGGGDLAGLSDAAFDLVLAVDVFPYLVQTGGTLAETMLTEIARVLRPGGRLALLNFCYGDVGATDPRDAAARRGLFAEAPPERPFRLWDATAFRLRRVGVAGGLAL